MRLPRVLSPGAALGLAATLLAVGVGLLERPLLPAVELAAYDRLNELRGPGPAAEQVVVVTLGDGGAPDTAAATWSRAALAGAVRLLARRGAKVIGLWQGLGGPEIDPAPEALRRLRGRLQGAAEASASPRRGIIDELARLEQDLDGDAALVRAVAEAGNVVLPVFPGPADRDAGAGELRGHTVAPPAPPRDLLTGLRSLTNPLELLHGSPRPGPPLRPPLAPLAAAAAGLGHGIVQPDADGVVRRSALLVPAGGRLVPSFALQVAALQLDAPLEQWSVQGPGTGQPGVRWGELQVPTDARYRLAMDFAAPVPTLSLAAIADGRVSAAAVQGKAVLVGTAEPATPLALRAPGGRDVAPLFAAARSVAGVLATRRLLRPHWAWLPEAAVTLLLGLFLTFVTPRVAAPIGATLLAVALAAWWGGVALLGVGQGLYLQVLPPVAIALLGFPVQTLWRAAARARSRTENADLNRMLGVAFQSQGMLDLAFERLAQCPLRQPGVREALADLGLDFERKRMGHKALRVYRHLLKGGRDPETLARVARLGGGSDDRRRDPGATPSGGTLVLDRDEVRPTLGRYEIIRELGQGASGTVYLGRDPKINREVAVKTLRYADFEEDQVDRVRHRFLREAEAAGKLRHPNIVTIYDVGEDHDLAYLAMELLDGPDLSEACRKRGLLPPAQVFGIVVQVAEGLAYAHQRGVVHRDIKPGNVMLTSDDTVKVTDFGIARVASSSHTQTGAVLGTPSYMSPEQVAGRKVDGRSDLFSLGVVLYELLTGARPFQGDGPAAIMYSVTRAAYPPLSELAPGLPACCAQLVDSLLVKPVSRRIKTAAEVAHRARLCREALT